VINSASRLLTAANVVLGVPVAYLGGLTFVAARAGRAAARPTATGTPTTRFAVLVPAHDEATVISDTLASIGAADYPSELFSVHVVADNCVDSTVAVAGMFGVDVHERSDPDAPGKGPALNWLIARLVERGDPFDVAVFVDADTTMDPGFLAAMDGRFRNGARAVQGNYGVRDGFATSATALRWCALACRHHLRPLARTSIGGSCGLFGNGMAFDRDLVVSRRWTDHLVEDMEFQLDLLLDGVTVEYAAEAKVLAEIPHTLEDSVSQHQRWERGRLQIARSHAPRLVRRLARPAPATRVAVADALADLSVPPLSLLGASVAASTCGGMALMVLPHGRAKTANVVAGLAMATVLAAHVLTALRLVKAPRAAYTALLRAPGLAAWKVRVMIRPSRGSQDVRWIRTRRNAEGSR
jgi:cellulose synthase/poly-beta-1,6-N-acetylglucosamine synthase-like glycosyltransferase